MDNDTLRMISSISLPPSLVVQKITLNRLTKSTTFEVTHHPWKDRVLRQVVQTTVCKAEKHKPQNWVTKGGQSKH